MNQIDEPGTLLAQTLKRPEKPDDGHALLLLWAEIPEETEEDEDENRTSKERLRYRQATRSRY